MGQDLTLFVEDSIKVGEKLFAFTRNLNMLFSIDIANEKITFLGGIPEEAPLCKRLTCKLIYWKEEIIIVPLLAEKVWIYSLENGKWKDIVIKTHKTDFLETNFRQAIIYQNSLYLIGGHYPAILNIDLDSQEVSYIETPFLNRRNNKIIKELYFRGDIVVKNNVLFLASSRDNSLLIFNLDTQTYKWLEIGGKENRYSGIMWDGNNYWISPRINTPIVKWDGKDQVVEYKIPVEKRVNNIAYSGIFKKDNQIIVPALAESGADTIILTEQGEMKFAKIKYTFYKKTEIGDYIAQTSDGNIIFLSHTGEKKQFACAIHGEVFCALLDIGHINIDTIKNKINNENNPFALEALVKLMNKTSIDSMQKEVNIGNTIWQSLK